MKILLFVMIFILLGGFFIISENNLALKERQNFHSFVDLYLNWIGNIYENSVSLTGNIIKMKWLPGE